MRNPMLFRMRNCTLVNYHKIRLCYVHSSFHMKRTKLRRASSTESSWSISMYGVEAPCVFLHNPINNIHLEVELGCMKLIQLESPNGIDMRATLDTHYKRSKPVTIRRSIYNKVRYGSHNRVYWYCKVNTR